ncbi:MAG: ribonuclease HII [Acidobacteriota bacterium]|nr:ribonuclease HII [Acidobacteriota bacterium]
MGVNPKLGGSRRKGTTERGDSPSIRCVSSYERQARERGFSRVAGVDEVGRGCLFGPVIAAAVILDPDRPIKNLRDSKIVEQEEREKLARHIKARCVCWAVGGADVYEIDQINIYQASRLAMRRAVEALAIPPDYLLIDALRLDLPVEQTPLINGDARCRAIAAASLVAKVHRDACLAQWHEVFPQFNLLSNKGYSTPDHRRALREHGPTLMHRFSFGPVRATSSRVHWTGYLSAQSPQGELFDLEGEAFEGQSAAPASEEADAEQAVLEATTL